MELDAGLDSALVARTRSGDAEAFGILIERHQKAVAGFLLSVTHDPDMAQEIAQVAFEKAFQNIHSFEGRSNFKTWVSRIAMNLARSHWRWLKLRRFFGGSPEEEPANWQGRLGIRPQSQDEFQALERKLELERAMKTLGRREREITALRLEGYSLAEIAQTLGISEGTVKSTLFDALRKLKSKLL